MKIDENATTSGNKILDLIEHSKAAKTTREKENCESELATLQLSAQIWRDSEPINFEGFPDSQINHHKIGEVNWNRFKSFKHILRVYAKVYRVIQKTQDQYDSGQV